MVKKGKKKGNTQAGVCNKSQHFEIGDLVVGQVRGYPFWPGRIIDLNSNGRQIKYKVEFFPARDTQILPPESIKPFHGFNPKPGDFKRKGYRQAFQECQEEWDSQQATKDTERESSPAPSLETIPTEAQSVQSGAQTEISEPPTLIKTSASPEPPSPAKPLDAFSEDGSYSSAQQDDDTSKKDNSTTDTEKETIEVEVKHEPSTVKVTVKLEKKSPQKAKRKSTRTSPTKLDNRTDDNNTVLPKEVAKEDPDSRDFTIKKLQRKIDAKLQEKARMKQEETEKRILKSTEALVRINKKLTKFLRHSQQLSSIILGIISENRSTSFSNWESAVKEFETIQGALVKCISFLTKKRRSDDLRNCRDVLTKLVKIFKAVGGNPKLPQSTNDKIKSCLKLMRKNTHIKDLINMPDVEFEKQENSMIERKENSVDQ